MYETWHTKTEAAALIGASVKTLERLAAAGEIQSAQRPAPGRKPATVYNPEDIGRIATAKTPGAFVMPAGNSQPGAMITTTPANAIAPTAAAGFGTWLENFTVKPATRPRRFMTLPEASEHCGLSVAFLRRAVKTLDDRLPMLASIKDGRTWKVRIDDVDKL